MKRAAAGVLGVLLALPALARCGNFVRLRPPFNATTLMLWGAPALALLTGVAAAAIARRRRPDPPAPLSDAERQRLADLLKS